MKRFPVLIAYDISNPLRRRRVRKMLNAWRIDGQKSVHECLLSLPELEELYVQLNETIDQDRDRLLVSRLHGNSQPKGFGAAEGITFFHKLIHIR